MCLKSESCSRTPCGQESGVLDIRNGGVLPGDKGGGRYAKATPHWQEGKCLDAFGIKDFTCSGDNNSLGSIQFKHTDRPTFLGSMLNFFLPIAICLFLCVVLLFIEETKKNDAES